MFLDRGKSIAGESLISEATIALMHQPHIRMPTRLYADEWCLGFYRKEWNGHALYGHNGTNLSGSSLLLWSPQKGVALATVVNVPDQGYPFADTICDVVFPSVFGIPKPPATTQQSCIPAAVDLAPYIGDFEAYGMKLQFTSDGSVLRLKSRTAVAPQTDVTDCELISLGDGRFLPSDRRFSGNRGWDIAFWGRDGAGRATNLVQGIFPLRRAG